MRATRAATGGDPSAQNEVGECPDAGPVMPENWMRGQFNMTRATGTVGVFSTLAPIQPRAVQHLTRQNWRRRLPGRARGRAPPAGNRTWRP